MTDTTTDTTPPEEAGAEVPEEAGAEPTPEETGKGANAEAARYRTRLRETEAERDGISERLVGYQRREAERIAGATLSRPADLWLDGVDPSELLDDDGQLDPEKVTAAVAGVLDGRPQLEAGRVRPRPDHAQGGPAAPQASGWQDVLQGRKA